MKKHFVLLMFLSAVSFATENYMSQEFNDQEVDDVESCSFMSVNPENIVSEGEGLFLLTEKGEYVRLPMVFATQTNCFILKPGFNKTEVVYPRIRCRNCQKEFIITIFNGGECPHCGYKN